MTTDLIVIGGGLAGSEAAWQAASRGLRVALYEMRPTKMTPAHATDKLAEIVCSNSLGANSIGKAGGLLKQELRRLGSLVMQCADQTSVPAGDALAVDRDMFSALVTERVSAHRNISVVRQEMLSIPATPTIIASGPLTAQALTDEISRLCGDEYLYFYDAMCPIVARDSIDMASAWQGSRWGRDRDATNTRQADVAERMSVPVAGVAVEAEPESVGDYINCALTKPEYDAFVEALVSAETIELKSFEREDPKFFEGCLPIEVMAQRGRDTLAFGPMRPIGLRDPRTGKRPHAVVQLRRDNATGTLYNVVGFQTNLKFAAQKRVLRMIPGLKNCEVMRYGQMHRNTFINSPKLLRPTMQFRARDDLFFAGQITGVEGYVGNIGSGLVAGVNAARVLAGKPPFTLPAETMLGALCYYVCTAVPKDFQPMKANFGILPPLQSEIRQKQQRYEAFVKRAQGGLEGVLSEWMQ